MEDKPMQKPIDFKKQDKEYYSAPGNKPCLVKLPPLPYLMIEGTGDPNGSEEFQQALEALFGLSYGVKMSPKKDRAPDGYYPYVVAPLEGHWSLPEDTHADAPLDKSRLIWTLMIRQPEFLKQDFLKLLQEELFEKKKNPSLKKVYLKTLGEGDCCQFLHLGPFDEEPASFKRMEAWVEEQGLSRKEKSHKEIYLSDFRRTAPEKLKTLLRFPVLVQ